MKKQDIIEKIEELIDELSNYESVAYVDIAMEIDEKPNTTKIRSLLAEADRDLDSCLDHLREAKDLAENLDPYEYRTTFKKAVRHITNMIMCNNIREADDSVLECGTPDRQSNDGEPMGEPMQFWLTDCTEDDVEWLCENYERIYFSYSVKLQLWVLIVDHWGSSWDIVEIGTHNESDAI